MPPFHAPLTLTSGSQVTVGLLPMVPQPAFCGRGRPRIRWEKTPFRLSPGLAAARSQRCQRWRCGTSLWPCPTGELAVGCARYRRRTHAWRPRCNGHRATRSMISGGGRRSASIRCSSRWSSSPSSLARVVCHSRWVSWPDSTPADACCPDRVGQRLLDSISRQSRTDTNARSAP